jgi:predicted transcriptional regulator
MIERQQVNLRLERELVEALDDLASTENVDRTEVARRILVDGVRRSRVDRALRAYADGRVTAWRAAGDAGVSLYEMLDRIHEAGIPYEVDGLSSAAQRPTRRAVRSRRS